MFTAIDIETMPNPDMIDKLPEPDVKTGNLKDPVKIKEKIDAAKAEQVKKMALSPLYGKVVCCGVVNEKENSVIIGMSEGAIIENLFEWQISFRNNNSPQLITWNGIGFDIPFIYKRALILGIKPPVSMGYWMKRYTTTPHCDLAQAWCGWTPNKYEKLDAVAKAVLGQSKIDFDVTTIPELIKTTEGITKLKEYCLQDTKLTYDLYNKFKGVIL